MFLGIGISVVANLQGGGFPPPPVGFAYLVNSLGNYLVDGSGRYLIGGV